MKKTFVIAKLDIKFRQKIMTAEYTSASEAYAQAMHLNSLLPRVGAQRYVYIVQTSK